MKVMMRRVTKARGAEAMQGEQHGHAELG